MEILILGGLLLVGLVAVMVMYNGLVGKKNQVENAFATTDALLKKRYDLIPNLISAVKAYMKHEEGILLKVTELRSQAMSGGLSPNEKVAIDNQISKGISGIMIAVENYPDLKANQNFLQLQGSMNEVEEQISAGRRAYNASVTDYNNAVEMFPTNIMANMMNYQLHDLFEISEEERQNVNVEELFNS